jgi:putative transposase
MTSQSYPQRKSPRLQGYDYSQSGAYFVTICTENRLKHFGKIENNEMLLNILGHLSHEELASLPQRWQDVEIDLFVVMPNHVHAILLLYDSTNKHANLAHIVGAYKAGVTRTARKMGLIGKNFVLWQERYHDHIIRHEKSLNYIRNYVATNPERWAQDYFYHAED